MVSHSKEGEFFSNLPSFNEIKVDNQRGCSCALEKHQNVVESHKQTPLKPYRKPIRIDCQDSYQKGGWIPDLRFQEGLRQNSYKALRKPLIGTPYTSNVELGNNLVSGFYRGKFTSLRGTTFFPTTHQWTKKIQTSATGDHVNKDIHEDQSSHDHDVFTSKNNAKDSSIEHTILVHEMDVDTIGSSSKAKKKEFKTFEKKESSSIAIPSMAKVVAGTRGLSSMPTTSFNLNVNLEDWPPLSNAHATYYPKNAQMYSLTSYQCKMNSRLSNRLNIDKRACHQPRLESKIKESIVTTIPSTRGSIDETISESITTSIQKGIMIGSVSVLLGDYVHPSIIGPETSSRRIITSLPVHQSYTTVLAAPSIKYTQDPIANSLGQQKIHYRMNHSKFGDSTLNMQVIDSYGVPIHYRAPSLRSIPYTNLNLRHVRVPVYPLGDRERGILSKQPSWSNGPINHLPQKIWRPIRSTSEITDFNSSSRISIKNSPISSIDKVILDSIGTKESIYVTSSQVEDTQTHDTNINTLEQSHGFGIDSRAQVGDQICVLDVKIKKESSPQEVTNCDESLILVSEQLQKYQETNQIASIIGIDNKNIYQPQKNNATKLNTNCSSYDKKDNIEKMNDKTHQDAIPKHSTWFVEAVEFHLNSKFVFLPSNTCACFVSLLYPNVYFHPCKNHVQNLVEVLK